MLFGYFRTDVNSYINRLSDVLSEKETVIDNLIREVHQLEYANDKLQIQIPIYKDLRKGNGCSTVAENKQVEI